MSWGRTKRSSGLCGGCSCPVKATEDVPIMAFIVTVKTRRSILNRKRRNSYVDRVGLLLEFNKSAAFGALDETLRHFWRGTFRHFLEAKK